MKTDEPHIVIGSDRLITVPKELRSIAVQYDHNIETVTFDCPRYWDGNDMSSMTVNINFVRSDGHEGTYVCKEVTIDAADPDIIHFDWTVSREVTEASGKLTVIICLKKDNAGGLTSQVWHSQRCETFSVLPGLLCDSVTIPSDPEYNGIQVDYNQNDELAADYIKNRPFYKGKEQTYTFTEDDYKNPVCAINYSGDEENPLMVDLYKISDIPVPIKQINDTTSSLHSVIEVEGEIQHMNDVVWWLDVNGDGNYPGDSDQLYLSFSPADATFDTPENIYEDTAIASFDIGLIVYKDINIREIGGVDVILTPGIYVLLSRDEELGCYFMFDDITAADVKRIDSSYLPTDVLNETKVKTLISENSITESQVRNLILQNSVTESRVNTLINNAVTSVLGGSS